MRDYEALLKEARDALENLDCAKYLLDRIDSALSAPDESALEIVRQIREAVIQEPCEGVQQIGFMLTDEAAAALVEPSVPRALFKELHDDWHTCWLIGKPVDYKVAEQIAAKHGVKVGA